MKKINLLITIIVLCHLLTSAQTPNDSVVRRDITIEREYNPVIMDAKKVNQTLSITEPDVEKNEVEYSQFTSPLTLTSPSAVLPQAPLTVMARDNYKHGHAKLAIGLPLKWDIELAYPLVNKKNSKLDFDFRNNGLGWDWAKGNQTDSIKNSTSLSKKKYIETDINLNFNHYLNNANLYVDLGYQNKTFNRYGTTQIFDTLLFINPTNSSSVLGKDLIRKEENLNTILTKIGCRSMPTDKFIYDANINYGLFFIPQGFLEHQFGINTMFNFMLKNKDYRIAFDFGMNNLLYGKMKNGVENLPKYSSAVHFSPRFLMTKKHLLLRAGIKTAFAIKREKTRVANISPDIEVEYFINPKMVSIYAGVGGDFELNSLQEVYNQNCFANEAKMLPDTYIPADFYAGVKVKPITFFFIDAYVHYKLIKDKHFFVNQIYSLESNEKRFSNCFESEFYDTDLLKVGLNLNYNYKEKFSASIKAQYNGWFLKEEEKTASEKAWQCPTWELNIGGDYNITSDIRVSASYYLAAERYAKMVDGSALKMRNIHDINLSASYSYSSWLSAYLQVNNLLGLVPKLRYQNWYGYDVVGSIMAGVIFSF